MPLAGKWPSRDEGQKGIRFVAPDTVDDGKVTSIKPVSVFDVTQTQERTQRAAA